MNTYTYNCVDETNVIATMVEDAFMSTISHLILSREKDLVAICGKCDSEETREKVIQLISNLEGIEEVDAAGLIV